MGEKLLKKKKSHKKARVALKPDKLQNKVC